VVSNWKVLYKLFKDVVSSLEVMARKATIIEEEVTRPVPPALHNHGPRKEFLTPPVAQIIAALIIAFAILLHGGIIKIKGVTPTKTGTGTTTTTTTAPAAPAAADAGSTSAEANTDKLVAAAEEQGLDGEEFRTCVVDQKFKAEFDKDNTDAATAAVNGTPGFVVGKSGATIDGIKISGAYPFETFKAVFDGLAAGTTTDAIIAARSADALEKATSSADDDAVLGNPNAPVTLIEFSDYECPFCQRHYKQVHPSIVKEYVDTGKVKIVFRDFVAVPGHNPNATLAALAATCAKEQGGDEAYYAMHDYYFQNTKSNGGGL
jgi:protein-disulfide isomerase